MDNVASAIVGPVVNVLTGHIKQKLGYLTSYAEHVERMKNRMKVLEDQSADIERLKRQHLSMPAHVPGWLEDVEKIKEDVDNILSNNIGCFNVKKKFLAGRNALRHTKVIEGLIGDGSKMISDDTLWREAEGCLGRVDSKNQASTSGVSVFDSRVKAFNDALKLLQQDDDHTARVIALCGMGGVGKTTLMKQLKKAAEDNKMFNWIVEAVIGNTPNLRTIQEKIAVQIGEPLTETDLREIYLSKRFEVLSKREEKTLVILDDVWEESSIKLEDIGLVSPLPNGVKLLLTSRDVKVCQQIAAYVNAHSTFEVVEVDVLEEREAQEFFFRIAGISAKHDHDLNKIGCRIVQKCGCLPLAIELIAGALKCSKGQKKRVWQHTLDSLKKYELDKSVHKIVELSYKKLKREEDKVIFLLCGLFPEDSNIPIEELTRYAWGLKLFNKVYTMEEARDSIETSVSNLKNAYLLMDGDSHHSDFVKLHDLVLAFAVATVSKGGENGCWIIHHEDDFSNWSEANSMSQSCKQLSLTCKGMSEFPSEFQFPNLSLLKLMHGDELLRFPRDFYVGMEKLLVIAFEKLEYPLVPTSFQCSTNLRTLCLCECSLMFDLTCIGNLSNLEVLSFANSGITILPSTFGNLKKLRLLDVTGCHNLVIDDGVFKNLVKLEELYLIPYYKKACCFTDNNSREFAERSENLQRFKLSVGCSFTEVTEHMQTYKVDMQSYENSLKLVTNIEELLKSKINELFKITDALYLQVNDMKTLPCSSFYNLRLLVVSECAELKYLFTPSVATTLSKLEYLEISNCDAMEEVIHTANDGSDIIMFSNLKYLRLTGLRKLSCFCNNINVIELPRLMELQLVGLPKITSIYTDSATSFVSSNISPTQSFLNKEDATPKLERLFVKDCDSIEVLFYMDFGEIEQLSSSLRSIKVDGCNSLVNLFSCNPFPFFNNLQELEVRRCCSIKVLFDIDSGRTGNIGEQVCTSSLRSIVVEECNSLMNLLPKNPMPLFNHLEELEVIRCRSIQVLFDIDSGHHGNIGEQVCSSSLRSIQVKECDSLVNLFSRNPFPFFKNLQELEVRSCRFIQVLFEIDSGRAGRYEEQDAAPKLEKLVVSDMENLKEIWPPQFSISNLCPLRELTVEDCVSIEVLFNLDFGEIEQLSSSLRSITVRGCSRLVKLFSSNPFPFLNNLQELEVRRCGSIEVLFNTDFGLAGKSEEQVCSSSSLRSIQVSGCSRLVKLFSCNPFPFLNNLQELKVYGCGSIRVLFNTDLGRASKSEKHVRSSSLRSIRVFGCNSLVNLLPSNPMPLFNHLEELHVADCASIEVIFDIDMGCVGEMDKVTSSRLRNIDLSGLGKLREVWRIKNDGNNNLIHGFEAVESIYIYYCERFENIITPPTTTFDMRALKKVDITRCGRESERNNELVESNQDQEIDVVSMPGKESNDNVPKVALPFYLLHTFHHLHELYLDEYKGVEVVFEITTPSSRESPHNTQQPPILPYLEELKLEDMGRMSHVWNCDWNEFLILQKPQQSQSSFHNLTTITMESCHSIKYLFSPLMSKLLSNLKKVVVWRCDGIEEIVSNRDDENASIYSHTTSTFFPHLDILKLTQLRNFKCIGGGANGISTHIHDQHKLSQASWSLCQYAREIIITDCDALSSVIPWYAVGQMQKLHVLKIEDCKSMTEEFETQEINNKSGTDTGKSLPRLEYITMLELPKLKILKIKGCNLLEHIFTFSTLESLTQLEELEVKNCKAMEVIVTEENGEQTTASDVVVFPHLKSLSLINLPNFVGFFLGKNEFRWPALEKVVIRECPELTVFTYGRSTAPKLNFINTSLGKHSVECGLNFHVTTTSHQAQLPSYESTSSDLPTTMERLPWSYHNLIEVDMVNTIGGRTLFSSDKLLQLQKLETVHCSHCWGTEEIFDSQSVAEIPNLRQVDLEWLGIKYIWKSKQGTVLKFPNLTRLSIDYCNSLEYVFTCPMVGSLLQLQELHIRHCNSMKVIVKGEEEECDAIVNAISEFPCLKSLKLDVLKSLDGFCLGKEAFEFPSLDTLEIDTCDNMTVFINGDLSAPSLDSLEIDTCDNMTVFTKGDLSAPKLYAISIVGWKYNIHNRLNSFLNTLNKRD